MTTYKSEADDQTYIDKYRVTANITEYHSISKFLFNKDIP